MKIIVIVLLTLLWCCSPIPHCPKESRIIKKGEFATVMTPDSLKWSIVSYKDFDNYCWKNKLGYIGSYDNYHLFFWWSKVLPVIGAEFQFAVLKTDWSPNEEHQYKLERIRIVSDSVSTQ